MIAETCLALAIYWEARNQPLQGKLAVAEVVLHRAHSELFPNDVCSVVYQGLHRWSNPVRNRCQFSWYCDGKSDYPEDYLSWIEAVRLARISLKVYPYTFTNLPHNTYYFHSTKKKRNSFFRKKFFVSRIGDHLFYIEN